MHAIKITEFPATATINDYKLRLKHKSVWKLRVRQVSARLWSLISSSRKIPSRLICPLMAPDISCLYLVSLHPLPASLQGLLLSVSLSCIDTVIDKCQWQGHCHWGWGHCKMSSEGLGEWLSGQLFYRRVPSSVPSTCDKLWGSIIFFWPPRALACVSIHSHGPCTWMNFFKKKKKNCYTSPKAVKLVIRKHRGKKCFSLPLYASL